MLVWLFMAGGYGRIKDECFVVGMFRTPTSGQRNNPVAALEEQ